MQSFAFLFVFCSPPSKGDPPTTHRADRLLFLRCQRPSFFLFIRSYSFYCTSTHTPSFFLSTPPFQIRMHVFLLYGTQRRAANNASVVANRLTIFNRRRVCDRIPV